jgi:hypothetical protein
MLMTEYYITIRPGEEVNCRGYALHCLGIVNTDKPVFVDRDPLEAFPLQKVYTLEEADAVAVQARVAGRTDIVHLPVLDPSDKNFVFEVPDTGKLPQRAFLSDAIEVYQDLLGYTVDYVKVIEDAQVVLQVHPDSPIELLK